MQIAANDVNWLLSLRFPLSEAPQMATFSQRMLREEHMAKRDYSLLGPDATAAVEAGLSAAEWYHTDIPRKTMKELMKRSDGPAIRDTIILFGAMFAFAAMAMTLWPRPPGGSAPFSGSPTAPTARSLGFSRWHEFGHGPPSRPRVSYTDLALYEVASSWILCANRHLAWSHARPPHLILFIVGRERDRGFAIAAAGLSPGRRFFGPRRC